MGRPPGSAESLRRNRVVTMVTDSELKRLSDIAEAENESLSATVHKLLARFLDAEQTIDVACPTKHFNQEES